MVSSELVMGDDDRLRCRWGAEPDIYRRYHDDEWGRPVLGDDALFEKLCLEGFQAGLSWLTILRRRDAFRAAFAGFEIEAVAGLAPSDVDRLVSDASIIRHRGKIEAAIANARAALELEASGTPLSHLIWSFRPSAGRPRRSLAEVPATTAESAALSRTLRSCGFRFVGPTTMYALMQAMGLVNDHLAGCWVHEEVQREQNATKVPGAGKA